MNNYANPLVYEWIVFTIINKIYNWSIEDPYNYLKNKDYAGANPW